MPQGTSIRTPDYAQDDEYKALLAQIAAFSPAAMMKQSNVIQSQERLESRHSETQARLARNEEKVSARSKLSDISKVVDEFIQDGNEQQLVEMFGGKLFDRNVDGVVQFSSDAAEILKVNQEDFNVMGETTNMLLKKNGSKRFQQAIFDQSIGKGLFNFQVPIDSAGTDVATKPVTLGTGAQKLKASPFYPSSYKDQSGERTALETYSFNINDYDQIRTYALNPDMGRKLYASWLTHNAKWRRLSPMGQGKATYAKEYADEYGRMDRVMRLIHHMNNMPPGIAHQMMDETNVGRQDIIPETYGGVQPGIVLDAELKEMINPEGYSAKLTNLQNKVNLVQSDPIYMASKSSNPVPNFYKLLSINQWGEENYRRLSSEDIQINSKIKGEGGKIQWLHPSKYGEDGHPKKERTSIQQAVEAYYLHATKQAKVLQGHFQKVGNLNKEREAHQRMGGLGLTNQFQDDNTFSKTSLARGMYTSKPEDSFRSAIERIGGFQYDFQADLKKIHQEGILPKDKNHFIFYGDKNDPKSIESVENEPIDKIRKLHQVWMNEFLSKNNTNFRLLGRGKNKWETMAQSQEFRDFIEEKLKHDKAYKRIIDSNITETEKLKGQAKVTKEGRGLAVTDSTGKKQHMFGTLYMTHPIDGKSTVVEVDLSRTSSDGSFRPVTFEKPGLEADGKPILETRWTNREELDKSIQDQYRMVGIDVPGTIKGKGDIGLFTVKPGDLQINDVKAPKEPMYAVHEGGMKTSPAPQDVQDLIAGKTPVVKPKPPVQTAEQKAQEEKNKKIEDGLAVVRQKHKELKKTIASRENKTVPDDVIVGADTTGTAQPVPASTSQGGGKKIKSDTIVDLPAGKEPKYDFGKAIKTDSQRKTIKNKLNQIEKLIAKPTSKLDYNLNIQLGVLKKSIPDFPIEFTAELLKTPEGLKELQEYINTIINSK